MRNFLLFKFQKNADFFRLKESEYRTVNGLKVLYIRYIANTKGLDFEYAGNYYLNDLGYCGVVAFSPQNSFEKNSVKIHELLNGISSAKKDESKEVIIYDNPPPPMKPKK